MLRNRSKAVTTNQALMADQIPSLSLTKPPSTTPLSSLISPRFFKGLLTNNHPDSETTLISPKSILDTKNSSISANPFGYERNLSNPPTQTPQIINSCSKTEQECIGLALIDSLNQENSNAANPSKPINRMVLFGSNLKVKIPAAGESPVEAPKSPGDFGIKTRNTLLLGLSPDTTPSREFSRQLSLKEMELSEDYTCVITHGPNPKTTHIFDDCVVESCIGEDVVKKRESSFESIDVSTSPSDSFLRFSPSIRDRHGCQPVERESQGKSPELK